MIAEVQVEATFPDGSKLFINQSYKRSSYDPRRNPETDIELNVGRETLKVMVLVIDLFR